MRKFYYILLIALCVASIDAQKSTKGAPESKLFDAAQLVRDVEVLSADDMEGRSADRPSMQKARDYVEKRFKESGLKPFGESFRQEFEIKQRRTTETLKGVNFVGEIKGKKKADKYIVITAHYDHVGLSKGEIYNGADDNASGTAALFAIAKYFSKKKPDHSLIFVAFDAEEKGLQGARHFVANLPVAKESILLNVNMDMLSRNDKASFTSPVRFIIHSLSQCSKPHRKKQR